MHTTYKIAIFLSCLFTIITSESYRPAKRYVHWKRDIRAATSNMWQSLADMFSSAVSNQTIHAQNESSHVKNMSVSWPGFWELCANLGNDTKVSEPEKSNQTGTFLGKVIQRAFKTISVEWHFPGYRYCGPNTNLTLRLPRADNGINMLDEACKDHDKSYMIYPDLESRIAIDRTLVWKAYARMQGDNATRGEKAAARVVVTALCLKLHVTTMISRVFGRKMQQKEK